MTAPEANSGVLHRTGVRTGVLKVRHVVIQWLAVIMPAAVMLFR